MKDYQDVLDDVDCMALYWMQHKGEIIDPACDEFVAYVDPVCYYKQDPSVQEVQTVNMLFTEWLLFECPVCDGMTPLELFVDRRPVAMPKRSWKRLRQVASTQFFSRFAIGEKDGAAGIAELSDVCGGQCYRVYDPQLCEVQRWKDGTIAERIARVGDAWIAVGQARLYDKASPEHTAQDGPGAVHPEERDELPQAMLDSFYLRLLHDVFGLTGRYSPTARIAAPHEGCAR